MIPIIQAIRSHKHEVQSGETNIADALISVDTFREDVAQAAIEAGANCINDVYAFTGPEYPFSLASAEHFLRMRAMARRLAVPVVLMHSRGEASANKDYSAYQHVVLEGVKQELGEKVQAAIHGSGGLRRWQIIIDPGIGFSKTVAGNLDLLRNASELGRPSAITGRDTLAGYPQLIGASRKSFIGTILEHPEEYGAPYPGRRTSPDERVWGTAVAVSCAVQQKVEVVRVHDVQQMRDIVTMSTALWG